MSWEPSAKRTSTHSSGVSALWWGHSTTRKVGRPTSPLLTGPVEKSHASLLSEKGRYFPVVSHTYLKRPAARCERGPGQTSTSSSSERVRSDGARFWGTLHPLYPSWFLKWKLRTDVCEYHIYLFKRASEGAIIIKITLLITSELDNFREMLSYNNAQITSIKNMEHLFLMHSPLHMYLPYVRGW